MEIIRESTKSIEISDREAHRLLGISGEIPVETKELLQKAKELVRGAAIYKACSEVCDITLTDENSIIFPFGTIQSRDLTRNLNGCGKCLLLALTIGTDADRLIKKYMAVNKALGVCVDAYCSSAAESFADHLNKTISEKYDTKPRFSPGYGDADISIQKDLLGYLEAGKNLGITLSPSFLMTPTKSITAFIGIQNGK